MKQETITEFKLSAPKTVKTLRELNWNVKTPHKGGLPSVTIPAGETIQVYFSEVNPSRLFIYDETTGRELTLRMTSASQVLSGFKKSPGIKSLERMSFDGVVTTPTGQRTEPDGYGSDGSPSWLLVLGLI